MKTEVVMKRIIGSIEVGQKSKSGYFNGNHVLAMINHERKKRGMKKKSTFQEYSITKSAKEFKKALSKKKDIPEDKLMAQKRGRYGGTYIHPYIMIDCVMWGCPDLKIEVIDWIHDNLLELRNDSGDSFKGMNNALNMAYDVGGSYWVYQKAAIMIAEACDVTKGKDKWETASSEQLKKRNKIQETVKMLAYIRHLKDPMETVTKAISMADM